MTAHVAPPRPLAAFAIGLTFVIAWLSLGAFFASTTDASVRNRLVTLAERQNLGDDADALFAHTATGGSAVPARANGEWVVKFKGVPPKALAFEDRPGRREEAIAMRRMLAGFFVKAGVDPPNASLSLETRGGDQALLGVELLDGRYERDSGVARYRLRSLKEHGDQPLRLPRRFGDSSVFIDDVFHTCTIEVGGAPQLALLGANKYSHDDWELPDYDGETSPASVLGGVWGSTSGFMRGCWNNAGYGDENGTVELSVSDPYTGANTYSCTATGSYICRGPDPSESQLGGDNVDVVYTICPVGQPDCVPWIIP